MPANKRDPAAGAKVDFRLFIVIWNQQQGQATPAIHFRMASWLEKGWRTGQRHLLLMAFRSSGKSTITGLFAAWLLFRNPDLRLLVLAADLTLARKMVRNVKRIIERHPLTPHLKPDRADQWGADRFTIKRERELRDPSMLAKGISANLTGSRADIVICDDVEVPNTCDTADKRADLRARLGEIDYVLVPGGTQLYVGTPHSYYTIYARKARKEIGEDAPFLEGFRRLVIPVMTRRGAPVWPEKYSPADLERMKTRTGPNKFASQMMLEPVNIARSYLDPAALDVYGAELEYSEAGQKPVLRLGERRLVSASAWWDPAFGSSGGDSSVLALIYTDADGEYWLHRLIYMQCDPLDPQDEATQQCRAVARAAQDFYLPSVALEINGLGRFLPAILRRELAANATGCAVREITSTRPKDIRIVESFDAVLAARALHVHRSVVQTPFMTEMQEWRPGRTGGRDDGLDAVAGALALEPVRLRRVYGPGGPGWTGDGGGHTAQTEFDV